ncbi:hypothetical protein ILUMI_23290 [Ignelater luminosus]|uniref:Zinc finger PHD-type domain-containing protein n=1 Tax=Ignelater luminosus TaxID=2038154 RepID=A0A8K0CFK1_IGNLU|nr:hypothetical protein ILUMI_23290 [Ignelater luminosus]
MCPNLKRDHAVVPPNTIRDYFNESGKQLEGVPPQNIFFHPLNVSWRKILEQWKNEPGRHEAALPKDKFPGILKTLVENVAENKPSNNSVDEQEAISPSIDDSFVKLLKQVRYEDTEVSNRRKRTKLGVIPGLPSDDGEEKMPRQVKSITEDGRFVGESYRERRSRDRPGLVYGLPDVPDVYEFVFSQEARKLNPPEEYKRGPKKLDITGLVSEEWLYSIGIIPRFYKGITERTRNSSENIRTAVDLVRSGQSIRLVAEDLKLSYSELRANKASNEPYKYSPNITNKKLENPVSILMDDHESHLSLVVIDEAREHGVLIFTFPPHCSHREPLGVAAYGPSKTRYNIADKFLAINRTMTRMPRNRPRTTTKAELSKEDLESAVQAACDGDSIQKLQAMKGENITAISAVSSARFYIPPMFIYPRKRMSPQLCKDRPTEATCPSILPFLEKKISWLATIYEEALASKKKKKIYSISPTSSSSSIDEQDLENICDDSDDDMTKEQETCFICKEFGKNEVWYRGRNCGQWAHKECSGVDAPDKYLAEGSQVS